MSGLLLYFIVLFLCLFIIVVVFSRQDFFVSLGVLELYKDQASLELRDVLATAPILLGFLISIFE